MARSRAKDEIERKPEACGDEARPLQDAQGTWQVAKPELIDKGERQYGIDGNLDRSLGTCRSLSSKYDVQNVVHMDAE